MQYRNHSNLVFVQAGSSKNKNCLHKHCNNQSRDHDCEHHQGFHGSFVSCAFPFHALSVEKIAKMMSSVLWSISEVTRPFTFAQGENLIQRIVLQRKHKRSNESVECTMRKTCVHFTNIISKLTMVMMMVVLAATVSPTHVMLAKALSDPQSSDPMQEAVRSSASLNRSMPDLSRMLKKWVTDWGRELGGQMGSFKKYEEEKACPERNAMDFLVNPPFRLGWRIERICLGYLTFDLFGRLLARPCERYIIGFSRCLKFDYLKFRSRFPESQKQFKGSFTYSQYNHSWWKPKRKFGLSLSTSLTIGFWYLCFLAATPVGQAKNPGPFQENPDNNGEENDRKVVWIGCANPTQMLGKVDCLKEWGSGVWTFAETSATSKAQLSIRNTAVISGFKVVFGDPVVPHHGNTEMRGRAGGVAIASDYPIRKFIYPSPDFAQKSTRFVDTIVQLDHTHSIYVSSLYGMASNSFAARQTFTNDSFLQATERALSFKGPAVICGDFNIALENLDGWGLLQRAGWQDAAIADSIKFGRNPQPTSKFGLRHSFILMNPTMAAAFYSCRTSAHYEFDSHPLLVAGFAFNTMKESIKKRVLPKSLDEFMFDPQQIN